MDALGNMPAGLMLAISGLAVGLAQYIKWSGIPDRFGSIVVVILAVVCVTLWALGELQQGRSFGTPLGYLFDAASIVFTAAGVYGFVRSASASGVIQTQKPPAGALDAPNGQGG